MEASEDLAIAVVGSVVVGAADFGAVEDSATRTARLRTAPLLAHAAALAEEAGTAIKTIGLLLGAMQTMSQSGIAEEHQLVGTGIGIANTIQARSAHTTAEAMTIRASVVGISWLW